MSSDHKLSLPAAILININIMMGVGLFMNTALLCNYAGPLANLSYLIIGVLVLPLILCIATLVSIHPSGGFYIYGKKEISPFAGFVSAWSYFTGKLASAMLMIHTAFLLLQQIIPALASINILALDAATLVLYSLLNVLHMRTGKTIQAAFLVFKSVPILFAIFGGLALFSGANFSDVNEFWQGIPLTIPLVLYATVGFEATASLSSRIDNAQRNGPLAIIISFATVILLSFLYQLMFYGALGSTLSDMPNFLGAFPALVNNLLPTGSTYAQTLIGLLHIAIASSALGGAYGIIFSNTWNLYELAQNNHTFMKSIVTRFNKHHIPVMCVVAEGLICGLYLAYSRGNQIPLQLTTAIGCALAYTLSVVALLFAKIRRPETRVPLWIPVLGLVNCAVLIGTSVRSFFLSGITAALPFAAFMTFGIVMFLLTRTKPSTQLERN